MQKLRACLTSGLVTLLWATGAAGQKPSAQQIREAVRPLHGADRGGATVLGYQPGDDQLQILRAGSGRYTCIADRPGDTNFQVTCYQNELELFMARGRALRAEGKTTAEVREIRRAEIEAEELPLPDRAVLISMFGTLAEEVASPDSVTPLYVIYLPHATSSAVGLPTTPSDAGPWLMDAGQHRAHVMISGPTEPFRMSG